MVNSLIEVANLSRVAHNGPAIKGVCVAEQVKAGSVFPLLGSVLSPAERSEAWRGFCHPGTRFCGHYECRGTRFVASRS